MRPATILKRAASSLLAGTLTTIDKPLEYCGATQPKQVRYKPFLMNVLCPLFFAASGKRAVRAPLDGPWQGAKYEATALGQEVVPAHEPNDTYFVRTIPHYRVELLPGTPRSCSQRLCSVSPHPVIQGCNPLSHGRWLGRSFLDVAALSAIQVIRRDRRHRFARCFPICLLVTSCCLCDWAVSADP